MHVLHTCTQHNSLTVYYCIHSHNRKFGGQVSSGTLTDRLWWDCMNCRRIEKKKKRREYQQSKMKSKVWSPDYCLLCRQNWTAHNLINTRARDFQWKWTLLPEVESGDRFLCITAALGQILTSFCTLVLLTGWWLSRFWSWTIKEMSRAWVDRQ